MWCVSSVCINVIYLNATESNYVDGFSSNCYPVFFCSVIGSTNTFAFSVTTLQARYLKKRENKQTPTVLTSSSPVSLATN